MKISNGNIWEFIFAIFFLSVGFNIDNLLTSIIVITISIIVIIHCIYLWIKEKKKEKENSEKILIDNKYKILFLISIVVNIIFIITLFIVINKNTTLTKQKKEYQKCISKIKYNTNKTDTFIWDPSKAKWIYKMDYILSENKFKKLQKCSKKYNIEIKTNDY